jgi:hypothetical protein
MYDRENYYLGSHGEIRRKDSKIRMKKKQRRKFNADRRAALKAALNKPA